ncbi:MAG: hypothetical protein Q7P63_17625 [Verrucomicrobiota bacterium JB022]|nr:hypothetical protein [Verrucomicrobiota bacterium JB022]
MKVCFTSVLALCIMLASAEAAVTGSVTPYSSRSELMGNLEKAFAVHEAPAKGELELSNPFAPPAVPVFQAAAPQAAAAEAKPAAPPPRLADSVAVVAVADTLQPNGSTVGLGRAFLLLDNNRRLEEGKTISATIQGQAYEVILAEVTMSSYTLRLGSASVTRPITSITDPQRIKRSVDPATSAE